MTTALTNRRFIPNEFLRRTLGAGLIMLLASCGGGEITDGPNEGPTTPALSENLALSQMTSQSTTAFGGIPERAVDGNNSGNYNDDSITHTETQEEPWWQVDLGQSSAIESIELWNRTGYENRLNDFVIFVTEHDPINRSYSDLLNDSTVWRYSFVGTPPESTLISVDSDGRFIRVQLPGTSRVLSLAEVVVNGTANSAPPVDPEPPIDPEPPVEPVDDCEDMTALMAKPELNCASAGCHSATPSQAARISLTGSLEQIAVRLGNVESVNSACSGEKVIDLDDPGNSLLLKLVDPSTDTACATKMPFGSATDPLSAEHYQCFVQWVDDIVAAAPEEEPENSTPFEPINTLGALNKTKSLIQGGAITDTEFSDLTFSGTEVNPDALKSAINNWVNTPEFETKFKAFLNLALQQDNVNPDGGYRLQFDAIGRNRNDTIDGTAFLNNIEDFFVRTAYKIFAEERDFRTIATTRDWEVTTAVLLGLAYTDNEGRRPGGGGGIRAYPFLVESDYTDWRTVTLTQGSTPVTFDHTEATVSNLRNIPHGGNLALVAPRVGFFTTPVFLQSWETNVGNKFRVTINQTLITGLGLTFEAGDVTPHGDLTALDSEHAGEQNPECYACHRMLDPMKQVFDNQFTLNRGIRGRANRTSIGASFAFHGYEAELNSIDDLGQAIFNHPNFAAGWVGKLCNWATSAPCDEDGAEFKRLVNVFKNSGHNMKSLVVEMFASPLVTGSEYIDDFDLAPPSIVLNRTNHFCSTIQARLNQVRASQGLPNSPRADICNLNGNSISKAALLPQDEYARGAINLIQSVSFDPFIATGFAQLCKSVENNILNYGAGASNPDSIFSANEVSRTLDEFVTYIMAIPPTSDGYAGAREALQKMYEIHRHPNNCEDAGLDPIIDNADEVVCGFGASNDAIALRPVWGLVCSTPSLLGLGF